MNKSTRLMTLVLTVTVSACGSTRRFVDQPPLTIDAAAGSAHQAATSLFEAVTPYTLSLCEADPASKECKPASTGIKANGVGGLLFPLILNVSAMTVSQQNASSEGWSIQATVQSKADAVSPLCRTAHGQIVLRANDTITLQLRNFYCNWLLVGNVLVNTDLSIDHIDSQHRAFTGFYKITFHGTGNASGSGYYKAVILPEQAPTSHGYTTAAEP